MDKLVLLFWPFLLVEIYDVFGNPNLLIGQSAFLIFCAIGCYAILYAIEHEFLKNHKWLVAMLVLVLAVSGV